MVKAYDDDEHFLCLSQISLDGTLAKAPKTEPKEIKHNYLLYNIALKVYNTTREKFK